MLSRFCPQLDVTPGVVTAIAFHFNTRLFCYFQPFSNCIVCSQVQFDLGDDGVCDNCRPTVRSCRGCGRWISANARCDDCRPWFRCHQCNRTFVGTTTDGRCNHCRMWGRCHRCGCQIQRVLMIGDMCRYCVRRRNVRIRGALDNAVVESTFAATPDVCERLGRTVYPRPWRSGPTRRFRGIEGEGDAVTVTQTTAKVSILHHIRPWGDTSRGVRE